MGRMWLYSGGGRVLFNCDRIAQTGSRESMPPAACGDSSATDTFFRNGRYQLFRAMGGGVMGGMGQPSFPDFTPNLAPTFSGASGG